MKSFKQLVETVNAPRSEAERNFIKKHVVDVKDYPVENPPADAKRKKDKSRDADYKDGEDEIVYEDIGSLVSEALLEGLNLKVGVMKFDDGSKRTVTRSDIEKIEKVYASTNDKLGMEKEIKKSKEDFESLIALGE
ncbi:hypothetical protein PHIN3_67 [Sinorhizobium phage phiN3]|uniref:Uncharacterized protein n=1 Tax=Sinorhizobium phage phiN3 TaxID=1647405 RepID=A0A0F6WCK4_9CAUD|nr:hypothetical protein AVT40_gp067 [Sinorhizobium phage phiN3]AKF13332.1 hypothetical protein PHIN3_67 [Sinorhizobium phage phiN3]